MAIDKKGTKQIADNRKARHDYFVLEQIECGIELVGTEVKSIRNGGDAGHHAAAETPAPGR